MQTPQRKAARSGWHEYGLWEYRLLANPDEYVFQKVKEEKQRFFDEFGAETALKTHPHITVATFLAKDVLEATLRRWIQKICSCKQRFTVTLNNYSGFPSGVIYLRIQETEPFERLAKQLKVIDGFLRDNHCPPLQLSPPHMTIARRLTAPVYEKAVWAFSQRCFHESFTLNELVLLKRNGRYNKWEHVDRFPLQTAPGLFN